MPHPSDSDPRLVFLAFAGDLSSGEDLAAVFLAFGGEMLTDSDPAIVVLDFAGDFSSGLAGEGRGFTGSMAATIGSADPRSRRLLGMLCFRGSCQASARQPWEA